MPDHGERRRTWTKSEVTALMLAAVEQYNRPHRRGGAMGTERCPTCGVEDRRYRWHGLNAAGVKRRQEQTPTTPWRCGDKWHDAPPVPHPADALAEAVEREANRLPPRRYRLLGFVRAYREAVTPREDSK